MIRPAWRVVIGATLLACIGAADAPRPAFGVGILRRDGIVIPFASFDGKRWRNAWPAPQLDLTVPINLASIPSRWWGPTGPLDSWQAWIAGTASSVRVVQPDWVGVHCARHIALRTDYRPAVVAPPQSTQPYPKDGLAVSPPQLVESIENLPVAGPAVRDVTQTLWDAFNRSERQTETRWGHPVSRKSREGVEPTIEAIYAFGDSPRVYYVEAIRPYRQLGQPASECAAVSIGTGWFIRDADGIRPLLMTVDILNCDRRGASYMLPLGAMRVGARLFWFAQFSGWDHERYVVIEITAKNAEALVSTWGGGC
jgi:hypothetical protein